MRGQMPLRFAGDLIMATIEWNTHILESATTMHNIYFNILCPHEYLKRVHCGESSTWDHMTRENAEAGTIRRCRSLLHHIVSHKQLHIVRRDVLLTRLQAPREV